MYTQEAGLHTLLKCPFLPFSVPYCTFTQKSSGDTTPFLLAVLTHTNMLLLAGLCVPAITYVTYILSSHTSHTSSLLSAVAVGSLLDWLFDTLLTDPLALP